MATDNGNLASKRSRNQEVDGLAVDRLSDLPESVLLHILSFLPAMYVVRSSVLSRRWQYVWTCVPCLDFGSELFDELESQDNFVNSFLFQYKATTIRKFRIGSRLNEFPGTDLWIRWAVNRNVEELDLSFPRSSSLTHHLPQTIFICKTLVVLKLKDLQVTMAFSPSACIPCLKTLELDSVSSPDIEFENRLISCCVVLESLSIQSDSYVTAKSYRIHAPTLEDLDVKVSGSCSLLLANVGNLGKAKLSLHNSNAYQSLLKCFSALNNTKCLLLFSSPGKQACNLEPGLIVHNLNLTHLTLGVGSVWVQLLPYFFQCFPNLEVLRLEKDASASNYAVGKVCSDPKLLAKGLLSHLSVFVMKEFRGTSDELGLLRYILKNGKVLESVRLHYRCKSQIAKEYTTRKGTKSREIEKKFKDCEKERCALEEMLQAAQNILNFPRGSLKCRIKFCNEAD